MNKGRKQKGETASCEFPKHIMIRRKSKRLPEPPISSSATDAVSPSQDHRIHRIQSPSDPLASLLTPSVDVSHRLHPLMELFAYPLPTPPPATVKERETPFKIPIVQPRRFTDELVRVRVRDIAPIASRNPLDRGNAPRPIGEKEAVMNAIKPRKSKTSRKPSVQSSNGYDSDGIVETIRGLTKELELSDGFLPNPTRNPRATAIPPRLPSQDDGTLTLRRRNELRLKSIHHDTAQQPTQSRFKDLLKSWEGKQNARKEKDPRFGLGVAPRYGVVWGHLSSEEKQRQLAIHEFITTESLYGHDLDVLKSVFIEPSREILNADTHQLLFGTAEAVVASQASRWLTKELKLRQRGWSNAATKLPDAATKGGFIERIGDAFVYHMNSMECYVDYCAKQRETAEAVHQLVATNETFRTFLDACFKDTRCRQLDLNAFLLVPMQRLTRYSLLLRQILHYTPVGHVDRISSVQALAGVEALLERANQAAWEREEYLRIRDIASRIQIPSKWRLVLIDDTRYLGPRRFVLGNATCKDAKTWMKVDVSAACSGAKVGSVLHAFLFSDLLLFCEHAITILKENGTKQERFYAVGEPLSLSEVSLKEGSTGRGLLGSDASLSIALCYHSQILTLRVLTHDDAKRWRAALKENIQRALQAESESVTKRIKEGDGMNRSGTVFSVASTVDFRPTLWTIRVTIHGCSILGSAKKMTAYCVASLTTRQTYRTALSSLAVEPSWEQAFAFQLTKYDQVLEFRVQDSAKFSKDEYIGSAEVDFHYLAYEDHRSDEEVKLKLTRSDVGVSMSAYIRVRMSYTKHHSE